MLPGRPIDVQAATILPQQRNGGLPDGTRPNTQRAREAARMADPAVPRALRDAAWEAQHLINVAGPRAVPDLIAAAAKAGWRTDDPANVAPLPASPAAQEKLAATGVNRPVHDSGHAEWNLQVRTALYGIREELLRQGKTLGSDEYTQTARKGLEKLQRDLRQKMLLLKRITVTESFQVSRFL